MYVEKPSIDANCLGIGEDLLTLLICVPLSYRHGNFPSIS